MEDGEAAGDGGCPLFKHFLEGYSGDCSPRKLLGAKIYTPKTLPGGKVAGRPSLRFVELWVPDGVVRDEEQKGKLIESKSLSKEQFRVLWSPI